MTFKEFLNAPDDEKERVAYSADLIEIGSVEDLKKIIAWLPSGTMLSMKVEGENE